MRKMFACVLAALLAAGCAKTGPETAQRPAVPSSKKTAFKPRFDSSLPCADAEEKRALNTRALQTVLMIAGLSCEEKQNYKRFVSRHKPYLGEQAKVLRAYFSRHYEGKSEYHMNKYVTRIANNTSHDSWGEDDEPFCTKARGLFAQVNDMDSRELAAFVSQDYYHGKVGGSCEPGRRAASEKPRKKSAARG